MLANSIHTYLQHASRTAIGCKSRVFTPPNVLLECKSTLYMSLELLIGCKSRVFTPPNVLFKCKSVLCECMPLKLPLGVSLGYSRLLMCYLSVSLSYMFSCVCMPLDVPLGVSLGYSRLPMCYLSVSLLYVIICKSSGLPT